VVIYILKVKKIVILAVNLSDYSEGEKIGILCSTMPSLGEKTKL